MGALNFKGAHLVTSSGELPQIILELSSNILVKSPALAIDLNGIKGFIRNTINTSMVIIPIEARTYFDNESKHLGSSLKNSIRNLGIKDLNGTFPDVYGHFHQFNSSAWDTLLRLMKYLPNDYDWVCSHEEIRVYKKEPDDYLPIFPTSVVSSVDYSMQGFANAQVKSGVNPAYLDSANIPISKNVGEFILNRDTVRNYLDSLVPSKYNMIQFDSPHTAYPVGLGVLIEDTKYVITHADIAMDSAFSAVGGSYRCVKV